MTEMTDSQRRAAEEVVRIDLEKIVEEASSELARSPASTSSSPEAAGFLGYYLVQAALAWNRRVEGPHDRIERHGDGQLPPRHAGLAGRLRRSDGALTLREHDIRQPLAGRPRRTSPSSSTPPGSPHRPTTAATRSRRWTRTSSACASLLDRYAGPDGDRASGRGLPVLLEQRDLRRPDARVHPDAGDVPRQRLVHRASRLLRRIEAIRRDALRQLRPAVRRAGDDRHGRSTTTGPDSRSPIGGSFPTSPATSSPGGT